jgi:hypothetical protein
MPLSNAIPYDPTENAIQISGEADGIFNNEDLSFYAEGVDVYNQESLTNINLYNKHLLLYHRSGYRWKRIAPMTQPSAGST